MNKISLGPGRQLYLRVDEINVLEGTEVVGTVCKEGNEFTVSGNLDAFSPGSLIAMMRNYGRVEHPNDQSLYQFVGLLQRFESISALVLDISKSNSGAYRIIFTNWKEFDRLNPEYKAERVHQ